MAVCSILVEFVRIDGARLGLEGLVKDIADKVVYTVGEMVSARKPILPPSSVVCIDTVLEEIWYILSTRVLYVGILMIGVTMGCGKESTIFSTAVVIVDGVGRVEGDVKQETG